jgi:deoxyadenosine/deoxycytidine kinase
MAQMQPAGLAESSTSGPREFNLMIEGPIAAGKTILTGVLIPGLAKKFGRVQSIKEPIDEWLEVGAFQKYCADRKNKSYEFQTFAFSTRVQEAIRAYEADPTAPCRISERSMAADQIFAEMLRDDGCFEDYQWKMYQSWCSTWERLWPWKPTHYIYVNPGVDICQQRVEFRGRVGEKEVVTDKYQSNLIAKYDQFFGPNFPKPILRLDNTIDYRNDPALQEELVEKVYRFLIDN